MARQLFGGIGDYVVVPGDAVTVGDVDGFQTVLAPGVVVSFYNAAAAGTQYTDLLDLSNTPITTVTTTADGALPQFWGPDGVTRMYAEAGGERRAVTAIDAGDVVTDLRATVQSLQETVSLLSNSVGTVRYDAGTSSWPERPDDSRTYLWIGPTAPSIGGGTGMVDGVDLWINPTPVT
ncbi:hypothetical protein ACGFNU_21250 [Spirillospora sp. NPDC048911]|uniref:hypothetical protein n=1 Tax=Spirillospora sp. NPDC048911 TaxID=3364527 RepID=UPI00372145E1